MNWLTHDLKHFQARRMHVAFAALLWTAIIVGLVGCCLDVGGP